MTALDHTTSVPPRPASRTAAVASARPKRKNRLASYGPPVIVFALFIGFWYLLHYVILTIRRASWSRRRTRSSRSRSSTRRRGPNCSRR